MERKLKLRQIAVIGCGESIPGRPTGLKIQPGGKYILYDKDAWKARAALERQRSRTNLEPEHKAALDRMEIAKEGDILKAEFEPESLHEAHLSNVLASHPEVYNNTYHILKKLAAAVKPGG